MTDAQAEEYAQRIEALWDIHAAARDALEQQAQDGIARDLGGVCPVVCPRDWGPVHLIESRWQRWLDKQIEKLNADFKGKAIPIAREYGEEWK